MRSPGAGREDGVDADPGAVGAERRPVADPLAPAARRAGCSARRAERSARFTIPNAAARTRKPQWTAASRSPNASTASMKARIESIRLPGSAGTRPRRRAGWAAAPRARARPAPSSSEQRAAPRPAGPPPPPAARSRGACRGGCSASRTRGAAACGSPASSRAAAGRRAGASGRSWGTRRSRRGRRASSPAVPEPGRRVAWSACDSTTRSKPSSSNSGRPVVDVGLHHREPARDAGVERLRIALDALHPAAAGADQLRQQLALAARRGRAPATRSGTIPATTCRSGLTAPASRWRRSRNPATVRWYSGISSRNES